MRKLLFTLVIISYSSLLLGQNVHPDFWDGVAYFKVKQDLNLVIPEYTDENQLGKFTDFPEIADIITKYQVTELVRPFKTNCPKVQNTYRIYFDSHQDIDNMIKEFYSLDYIAYIEKSVIFRTNTTPNDSLLDEQYYLTNVKAFEAWEVAESNYKPVVAVVDDAVMISHPDMEANVWVNPDEIENGEDTDGNGFIDDIHGYDVADGDNNPNPPDDHWAANIGMAFMHGTHCAGIAGAVANNEIGIAGVANNNIRIMGVKAARSDAMLSFSISHGPEGVDYAVKANADIVSMSFGATQVMLTLGNIINAGVEKGIIFVAAAGNDGNEVVTYPAGFDNVIAVGGSNQNDELWNSSQRGEFIDILAPATGILSLMITDNSPYMPLDGTSMACPIVAGALALMMSHAPDATPEELIACLLGTADNVDDINPDFIGKMGTGRLNMHAAIHCLGVDIPYDVNISVYPENAGEFMGQGTYYPGDDVTILAAPFAGYEFVNWTDDNSDVFATNGHYTFTMPEHDLNLTANFEELEDENYVSNMTDSKINVFPNPFDNVIFFENTANIERVRLSKLTGQVVVDIKNPEKDEINTSEIPEGFYILQIENTKGEMFIQKIVK